MKPAILAVAALLAVPAAAADGFVPVPAGFSILDTHAPEGSTVTVEVHFGRQVVVVDGPAGLIAVHMDDDGNASTGTSVAYGWSNAGSPNHSGLATLSDVEAARDDLRDLLLLVGRSAGNASEQAEKAAQAAAAARQAASQPPDLSDVLRGQADAQAASEAAEAAAGGLFGLVLAALLVSVVSAGLSGWLAYQSRQPSFGSMPQVAGPSGDAREKPRREERGSPPDDAGFEWGGRDE